MDSAIAGLLGDGKIVALNYLVRNTGSDWRVIDVYLNGAFVASTPAGSNGSFTDPIANAVFFEDDAREHLIGVVDALRISSGARSTDEISAVQARLQTRPYGGPTCDDGLQNGDEEDIDCGGSCPAACP